MEKKSYIKHHDKHGKRHIDDKYASSDGNVDTEAEEFIAHKKFELSRDESDTDDHPSKQIIKAERYVTQLQHGYYQNFDKAAHGYAGTVHSFDTSAHGYAGHSHNLDKSTHSYACHDHKLDEFPRSYPGYDYACQNFDNAAHGYQPNFDNVTHGAGYAAQNHSLDIHAHGGGYASHGDSFDVTMKSFSGHTQNPNKFGHGGGYGGYEQGFDKASHGYAGGYVQSFDKFNQGGVSAGYNSPHQASHYGNDHYTHGGGNYHGHGNNYASEMLHNYGMSGGHGHHGGKMPMGGHCPPVPSWNFKGISD